MAALLGKYLFVSETAALDPRLTRCDVAVVAAMTARSNDKGRCWPSTETLAQDCTHTSRAVRDSLVRLVRFGYVSVDSGSSRRSNRYVLHFEVASAMPLDKEEADFRFTEAQFRSTEAGFRTREAGFLPTHLSEPVGVQREGSGDTPDALPRAVAPAPEGISPEAWGRLLRARPELDAAELAESVAHHQAEGCPADLLNTALDGLRLHRGHRSLSPAPYRRPKAPREARQAKPQAPTAPAPMRQASASGASIVRLVPAVEPLRALYRQRFGSNGNTHCAERERCAERLRREFPELADAITAKSNDVPFPFVSDGQRRKIAEMLADEWSLVSARQKAKRDAFAARHAGASR